MLCEASCDARLCAEMHNACEAQGDARQCVEMHEACNGSIRGAASSEEALLADEWRWRSSEAELRCIVLRSWCVMLQVQRPQDVMRSLAQSVESTCIELRGYCIVSRVPPVGDAKTGSAGP